MARTIRAETAQAEWAKAQDKAQDDAIPGLPAAGRLTLVQSIDQLRDLEPAWRKLENSNQAAPNVFTSFDWCLAWSETYATGKTGNAALQVVAGYDRDTLAFVFPLMSCNRMGQRVLCWLTEPFGQYGDVLCAKGQNARQWIDSAFALLGRFKDIDIIHLRHVREDSLIARHGAHQLVNARVPEQAPYLDLTTFKTEQDYETRYTSAQRKRRKKIRKWLEDMGPVAFSSLPAGSMADAAMDQALAEKNAWLNERGRINRVMSCPSHLAFLKRLARRSGNVETVVTELRAGNKPVSWEIGFRFGDTHFAYITSHMNALTDLSPGRLHMDLSQRGCIAAGLSRFDLMVPNDAHKESWSSAKINTDDFYRPLSLKGTAYGHVYLRLLRPWLRDLYYWMEPRALRHLTSFKRGKKPTEAP